MKSIKNTALLGLIACSAIALIPEAAKAQYYPSYPTYYPSYPSNIYPTLSNFSYQERINTMDRNHQQVIDLIRGDY
jgi:hypothetical protein